MLEEQTEDLPDPDDFDDASPNPAQDTDLAILSDFLQEQQIVRVLFRYQGSGDSGAVEEIEFSLDPRALQTEHEFKLPLSFIAIKSTMNKKVLLTTKNLPQLPHGQLSSGRHQCPPRWSRGPDARVADPQKTPPTTPEGGRLQIGMVAGFISERWPASNRNPGRLHVGTPGRIKSESAHTVWRELCISHFRGEESSAYIIDRSLMRPRNVLKIFNHCRGFATDFSRQRISEVDIDKGLKVVKVAGARDASRSCDLFDDEA